MAVFVVQGLVFEQFTVNMLNLMRSILRCEAYTPAKTLEGQISSYVFIPMSQLLIDRLLKVICCS